MNRRVFITGIGVGAISGVGRALEVDSDDAIRGILRQRIEVEKRSVGMAVCVVTPDRKRIVTWGRERLSDNRPVSPETVFEIASITKIFTALLLADMVRRSEVGLDDPASRHLPGDFKLPLRNGREITLADLATHTSGLPRWPLLASDKPPSQSEIDAAMRIGSGDFKAWLADVHPQNPPSAGAWWYSNVGYALLGMALAYRWGKPYEVLLQTRVIDPIGLRDTTFRPTAAMAHRLAEGHDLALKPIPPIDVGIYIAAGGLHSTPRDLARFAAVILGSSSVIAQDNQRLLTVRRAAPWLGGVQALGWEVLNAPGGTFVSKDGVSSSQTAAMVYDPEKRKAIVAFSNTSPEMSHSTLSGGGVGAADIARHLLRPGIPLNGDGGTSY